MEVAVSGADLNCGTAPTIRYFYSDKIPSNMSTGAEVRGRFEMDGVLLEYRAYPLPNGSVNVLTLFQVKP